MLQVLSRRLRLSGDFNFHSIAKLTPGFVGADLAALLKEAAAIAVTRIFQQLDAPVPAQLSDAVEHHPLAQRWELVTSDMGDISSTRRMQW